MALKLMIFVCYFFVDGMVMAGAHSRERPSSRRPLDRTRQPYDDIVVVESPMIDLVVNQGVPRPVSPSGHQVSGQYYTPGAPAGDIVHGNPIRYDGPTAVPMVLEDGTLADTPEVAAARTAHLIAVEQAKTLASVHDDNDDGSYNPLKYEYDEHVPHHGGQGHTSHGQYSGVEAVQGPLNSPYQRPLLQQQSYNGQYYGVDGQQHFVNDPTRQTYPVNKQHYGTHGYNGPEHTQAFVPQRNINKHHLERLAARGLLTRQDIDTVIAEHPENKGYLEQLSYQLGPDNYYSGASGVQERPLHDVSMHDNQKYFTPANSQIISPNEPSNNYINLPVPSNHVSEQYPNVVAVQPPITNAMYDTPIQKVIPVPIRNNGEHVLPTVQHATEQYSSTVAESPIKSSVGTDTIIKEVVGYSATYNGPKADNQEHHYQYSNLPVQSTLDNPVDPNFIYNNTYVQTAHPNHMEARFEQHTGNNYVGNTHYVQAPVNGRFVATNNLAAAHPYTKPYDGPQAQVHYQESGYLSDTPEVAAAKAAHFTAHQIAREHHAQWIARHQGHH